MVPGMDSPARRAWLIGRIAVPVVVTAVGATAIVHYASFGTSLASENGSATALSAHQESGISHRAGDHRRSVVTASKPAAKGHAAPARHRAGRTSPHASPTPRLAARVAAGPIRFRTLPPGAKLPSGAQCARWVRASPSPEIRPSNRVYNHARGQRVSPKLLAFDGPKAEKLARRIDGDFTGTTQEILRWAACKWGIDQNMVFAQAAIESWWRQTTLGDFGTDPSLCPPGHGLGVDGKPGECPQSYGILQNRYPYEKLSWPGIGRSTATNADTAYAIWRACYDGYETWLNTVPRGRQYHAGDAWGCVGRWFAGRWRTAAADGYIKAVRKYMSERIWLTPNFRHAG